MELELIISKQANIDSCFSMSVTELSGEKRSPDDDASVNNNAKRQKLAGIMNVIF